MNASQDCTHLNWCGYLHKLLLPPHLTSLSSQYSWLTASTKWSQCSTVVHSKCTLLQTWEALNGSSVQQALQWMHHDTTWWEMGSNTLRIGTLFKNNTVTFSTSPQIIVFDNEKKLISVIHKISVINSTCSESVCAFCPPLHPPKCVRVVPSSGAGDEFFC